MSAAIKAFPLAWPVGWKRTPTSVRREGKFSKKEWVSYQGGGGYNQAKPLTVAAATQRLLGELTRMGIPERDVILSTNLELRNDGLPRSGQRVPADPGAAVYWRDGAEQRCMASDQYQHIEDNIAALAATIEAMRAIERHGGAQILNRAFAGFAALPAPTGADWWDVLECRRDSSPEVVKAQYRRLASDNHPDRGGSDAKMTEINAAWTAAQRELGNG
jgi:hypothetical protein